MEFLQYYNQLCATIAVNVFLLFLLCVSLLSPTARGKPFRFVIFWRKHLQYTHFLLRYCWIKKKQLKWYHSVEGFNHVRSVFCCHTFIPCILISFFAHSLSDIYQRFCFYLLKFELFCFIENKIQHWTSTIVLFFFSQTYIHTWLTLLMIYFSKQNKPMFVVNCVYHFFPTRRWHPMKRCIVDHFPEQ